MKRLVGSVFGVMLCSLFLLTACGGGGSSKGDGGLDLSSSSSSSSTSSSSSSSNSSSSSSGAAAMAPKVVGYIPSYKGLAATVEAVDLSQLTHINISFLNPNAAGAVIDGDLTVCMEGTTGDNVTGTEIRDLVDTAHAANVKVLVSVAGGVIPDCSGDWETLLEPANRQTVIDNLVQFVDDFDMDGLDIDIEGAILTAIDNAGNYTPFIATLREEMDERGKLLTAATASYVGGMVPVSSIPYFDFVTIMSYDAIGPNWGPPGVEHSTYAQAENHVAIWQDRGLTKEQLVLGVPFYGYGFGSSYKSDYAFADIVAQFGEDAANKDLIGEACNGCEYITYNGLPTIRKKTELALQEGSGVMIWELSHDAAGEFSLLNAIDELVDAEVAAGSTD